MENSLLRKQAGACFAQDCFPFAQQMKGFASRNTFANKTLQGARVLSRQPFQIYCPPAFSSVRPLKAQVTFVNSSSLDLRLRPWRTLA